MVVAAEMLGRPPGHPGVVHGGLSHPVFGGKSDGVGLHRAAVGLGHHGHDAAGIQPGAQEGPDGHVADHLRLHRLAEAPPDLLRQFAFGQAVIGLGRRESQVPILLNLQDALF